MMLTEPDDGSGRLFIVDQIGLVRILAPGAGLLETPFLDLRDRLVPLNPRYDERGLLSLAFHPGYAENGRLFVFYSAPLRPGGPKGWNCTNRLSEFRVSRDDPDRADPGSERVLLTIDKPAHNHNGGPVLFGPDDGYLYLALGDGGGADDTGPGHTPGSGNAQDLTQTPREDHPDRRRPSRARTERCTRSRPTTRSRTLRASCPRSTPWASGIRRTSPSTPGPGTG